MDKDSFISHITRNRRKWLYIARSMLPERDCEDALQSSILSAWEHLPQLKDEQAFDAWFKQILINRCRQMQRGYKRDKDILNKLSTNENAQEESDLCLNEALDHLKPEEQNLIRLHHEQGYSLKEIAELTGYSEDVLKMHLYRARKHLKVVLITLLLMLLLAAAAVGTGLIDVNWFLQNRRSEPTVIEKPVEAVIKESSYTGDALLLEVSNAVWNYNGLSLSFVYSITGTEGDKLIVHRGNIGVDGIHHDHIWTDDQIFPITQWANGKDVKVFSLNDWKLGDMFTAGSEDYFPDGKGDTFFTEIHLDSINPERYEKILDENGFLEFTSTLTLADHSSGTLLESGTITLLIEAPSVEEWRNLYETYIQ